MMIPKSDDPIWILIAGATPHTLCGIGMFIYAVYSVFVGDYPTVFTLFPIIMICCLPAVAVGIIYEVFEK